jgi:hypothetical protein
MTVRLGYVASFAQMDVADCGARSGLEELRLF